MNVSAYLRAVATGLVWVVFAVFSMGLLMMSVSSGAAFFVLLAIMIGAVLGLAALYLTVRIWQPAQTPVQAMPRPARAGYKAKHEDMDRVARLLDELDEEDVMQLEALLRTRDSDYLV